MFRAELAEINLDDLRGIFDDKEIDFSTADLGAILTLGSSLTLRIYQESARLGRGPALTKTLFF
jgi:hypothetical protein